MTVCWHIFDRLRYQQKTAKKSGSTMEPEKPEKTLANLSMTFSPSSISIPTQNMEVPKNSSKFCNHCTSEIYLFIYLQNKNMTCKDLHRFPSLFKWHWKAGGRKDFTVCKSYLHSIRFSKLEIFVKTTIFEASVSLNGKDLEFSNSFYPPTNLIWIHTRFSIVSF